MMMVNDVKKIGLYCGILGLLLVGNPLFAQLRLGDNLGSHKATKDLEMATHNIKAAGLVNASGVLIGTATTLSNTSIALQVDGLDKAILVPRVTNLLSASTPSIPLDKALNGMIVYDLFTSKFYYRQNNAWVVYVDAVNYVDRYLPQLILGKKTFQSDSGFVATGTYNAAAGIIPAAGAGTRMMWYPKKSAFRAGTTGATQWEDNLVGNYSTAMGYNVTASGVSSVALGSGNVASGSYSMAAGAGAAASGSNSFAFGYAAAQGDNSIALGISAQASSANSVSIGTSTLASGIGAVAIGTNAIASAEYSFALGNNTNTNLNTGSMILGDGSLTLVAKNSVPNQFMSRFAGGYRFYTSADTTKGFFAVPAGVLKYKADYSASYDDRSLIDRGYMKSNYVDFKNLQNNIGGLKTFTSDSGFVATGTFVGDATTVPTPVIGAGIRMMWYPAKAAFRAGRATGAEWDLVNVGINSTAFGYQSTASGAYSFVAGNGNRASGNSSVAMGNGNVSTGSGSFAGGSGSYAAEFNSFAFGYNSAATAEYSFAFGNSAAATGVNSVAIGNRASAPSLNSVAIGNRAVANGANTMAFGTFVDTNGKDGSMVMGDASNNSLQLFSDVQNRMSMRFDQGYKLFTRWDYSTGVYMSQGASSWATISDKRKKTNFETIDAESFLLKIDTMQLGSWNYKSQDAKTFRHYGPMAQDFYGAFGKDSYGTIGCDTLIASADFDGVNMIAIKGLVTRTNALMKSNTTLTNSNADLTKQTTALLSRTNGLAAENDALKLKIAALETANKDVLTSLEQKFELLSQKLQKQEENNAANKIEQRTTAVVVNNQ